jgi:hypothetical protein
MLAVADTIVKVPQMAESISEGTLKQFSKREQHIAFRIDSQMLSEMQRSEIM